MNWKTNGCSLTFLPFSDISFFIFWQNGENPNLDSFVQLCQIETILICEIMFLPHLEICEMEFELDFHFSFKRDSCESLFQEVLILIRKKAFMREFPYLGDILPSALSCLLDQGSSLPFCHSLSSPSSLFDKIERILIWIHLYNCDKLRQS